MPQDTWIQHDPVGEAKTFLREWDFGYHREIPVTLDVPVAQWLFMLVARRVGGEPWNIWLHEMADYDEVAQLDRGIARYVQQFFQKKEAFGMEFRRPYPIDCELLAEEGIYAVLREKFPVQKSIHEIIQPLTIAFTGDEIRAVGDAIKLFKSLYSAYLPYLGHGNLGELRQQSKAFLVLYVDFVKAGGAPDQTLVKEFNWILDKINQVLPG